MCSLSLVTNWRYIGLDLKWTTLDPNNKYVFKESQCDHYHWCLFGIYTFRFKK